MFAKIQFFPPEKNKAVDGKKRNKRKNDQFGIIGQEIINAFSCNICFRFQIGIKIMMR